MFPEWFTKPENLFKTILWLLSPVYVWLAKKAWQRLRDFNSASSERAARISLVGLRKSLDNPPTLLQSVAYLVCFLPVPVFQAMAFGALYFAPRYVVDPIIKLEPDTVKAFYHGVFFAFFLFNYALFGVLTIYGVRVAYHLRHGEARYAENYKAGIQKRIDKLRKKYPNL